MRRHTSDWNVGPTGSPSQSSGGSVDVVVELEVGGAEEEVELLVVVVVLVDVVLVEVEVVVPPLSAMVTAAVPGVPTTYWALGATVKTTVSGPSARGSLSGRTTRVIDASPAGITTVVGMNW